jgi:MFS family permease
MIAGVAPWFIFGFALLQGAAIGIMTILRPVLIADVLGNEGYGAIAGSLQVMPLMAGAAAPMVGGLLFEAGGAWAIIGLSACVIALAFVGTLTLRRR